MLPHHQRVLREDVEKKPKMRHRSSAVVVFDAQIAEWLVKNLPVMRMLELARADGDHPHRRSLKTAPGQRPDLLSQV